MGSYDLTVEDDVLFFGSEQDAERFGLLLSRVIGHADQLELELLELDQHLSTFRSDLAKEGADGQ